MSTPHYNEFDKQMEIELQKLKDKGAAESYLEAFEQGFKVCKEWVKQKQSFEFQNGSKIEFHSTDEASQAKGLSK